ILPRFSSSQRFSERASIHSSGQKRTARSLLSRALASVVLPEPGNPHTTINLAPVPDLSIRTIRSPLRRLSSSVDIPVLGSRSHALVIPRPRFLRGAESAFWLEAYCLLGSQQSQIISENAPLVCRGGGSF